MLNLLRMAAGACFGTGCACLVAQSGCDLPIGSKQQPWKVDRAVAFQSNSLAVDADGTPDSYLVNGAGLSETCVGVVATVNGKRVTNKTDPNHWYGICQKAWVNAQKTGDYSHVAIFGFLADSKGPVVQAASDPLPGKAFITTTTLTVPDPNCQTDTQCRTQRHWVDARKIPYIVLPPYVVKNFKIAPGDIAVVYRSKTSAVAYGIFANSGGLGEASVKLHQELGNDPITIQHGVPRANRGIPDRTVTVVFPGIHVPASLDVDSWNEAIQRAGIDALGKWGGLKRLQECVQ